MEPAGQKEDKSLSRKEEDAELKIETPKGEDEKVPFEAVKEDVSWITDEAGKQMKKSEEEETQEEFVKMNVGKKKEDEEDEDEADEKKKMEEMEGARVKRRVSWVEEEPPTHPQTPADVGNWKKYTDESKDGATSEEGGSGHEKVEKYEKYEKATPSEVDQKTDELMCQAMKTKEPSKPRGDSCKDENGFTYYKCRFCGLTFNYMTTLKAHERVHDVTQPYLCNKCGESFHYMCELEYHAKTHLKQKGYKCECGRTFFQYTDLLYHKHPGEDEPFPALPMPSASAVDLSVPAPPIPSAPIHPAEFPVPEFAEQGFEPKYQLKRGLSDVRSKPYICQYCSKSYADSRGLAYHMYSHRGERTFNPRASRYLMCRNDNSYISSGIDLRDA